jgi:hypothetical protein
MTIEEQLIATLHDLPPQQQAEVMDFAAFLRDRLQRTSQPTVAQIEPLPRLSGQVPPGWKDAIYESR